MFMRIQKISIMIIDGQSNGLFEMKIIFVNKVINSFKRQQKGQNDKAKSFQFLSEFSSTTQSCHTFAPKSKQKTNANATAIKT